MHRSLTRSRRRDYAPRVRLGRVAHPRIRETIAFLVPLVLAFLDTWLYNKSGSMLFCILLHASITAAIDQLVLTPDSTTVDLTIFGAFVAAALALIVVTGGGLGLQKIGSEAPSPAPAPPKELSPV